MGSMGLHGLWCSLCSTRAVLGIVLVGLTLRRSYWKLQGRGKLRQPVAGFTRDIACAMRVYSFEYPVH